jgi:glycosyltransferase involved in cell wall biosynthesis
MALRPRPGSFVFIAVRPVALAGSGPGILYNSPAGYMTGRPIFSVLIPTRDRAETLRHCLRTALAQDYASAEIIVSDNFSGDGTRKVVSAFRDPRLKYFNTGRRLGMAGNFEFALSKARGSVLAFLGDDDGLLPGALARAAAIFRSTGTEALQSSPCMYAWPSLTGRAFGRFSLPRGGVLERRDCRKWLGRVLAGKAGYPELPMLYTGGFIKRSAVVKASRGGPFFRSPIPDVYSALALSSVLKNYIYSNEPLALTGASGHSTGISVLGLGPAWVRSVITGLPAARGAGKKAAGASPSDLFVSEDNLPFHASLPRLPGGKFPPSLQALVYESFLQSAHLRGPAPRGLFRGQLELILAGAGPHRRTLESWCRKLAADRGEDFNAIRRAALKEKGAAAYDGKKLGGTLAARSPGRAPGGLK